MKGKKILFKLCYYSYIIIVTLFVTYLLVYTFLLKDAHVIYYKYLLIFLAGILLGYILSDGANTYLRKSKKTNEEK